MSERRSKAREGKVRCSNGEHNDVPLSSAPGVGVGIGGPPPSLDGSNHSVGLFLDRSNHSVGLLLDQSNHSVGLDLDRSSHSTAHRFLFGMQPRLLPSSLPKLCPDDDEKDASSADSISMEQEEEKKEEIVSHPALKKLRSPMVKTEKTQAEQSLPQGEVPEVVVESRHDEQKYHKDQQGVTGVAERAPLGDPTFPRVLIHSSPAQKTSWVSVRSSSTLSLCGLSSEEGPPSAPSPTVSSSTAVSSFAVVTSEEDNDEQCEKRARNLRPGLRPALQVQSETPTAPLLQDRPATPPSPSHRSHPPIPEKGRDLLSEAQRHLKAVCLAHLYELAIRKASERKAALSSLLSHPLARAGETDLNGQKGRQGSGSAGGKSIVSGSYNDDLCSQLALFEESRQLQPCGQSPPRQRDRRHSDVAARRRKSGRKHRGTLENNTLITLATAEDIVRSLLEDMEDANSNEVPEVTKGDEVPHERVCSAMEEDFLAWAQEALPAKIVRRERVAASSAKVQETPSPVSPHPFKLKDGSVLALIAGCSLEVVRFEEDDRKDDNATDGNNEYFPYVICADREARSIVVVFLRPGEERSGQKLDASHTLGAEDYASLFLRRHRCHSHHDSSNRRKRGRGRKMRISILDEITDRIFAAGRRAFPRGCPYRVSVAGCGTVGGALAAAFAFCYGSPVSKSTKRVVAVWPIEAYVFGSAPEPEPIAPCDGSSSFWTEFRRLERTGRLRLARFVFAVSAGRRNGTPNPLLESVDEAKARVRIARRDVGIEVMLVDEQCAESPMAEMNRLAAVAGNRMFREISAVESTNARCSLSEHQEMLRFLHRHMSITGSLRTLEAYYRMHSQLVSSMIKAKQPPSERSSGYNHYVVLLILMALIVAVLVRSNTEGQAAHHSSLLVQKISSIASAEKNISSPQPVQDEVSVSVETTERPLSSNTILKTHVAPIQDDISANATLVESSSLLPRPSFFARCPALAPCFWGVPRCCRPNRKQFISDHHRAATALSIERRAEFFALTQEWDARRAFATLWKTQKV